jgi:hypothetical protein
MFQTESIRTSLFRIRYSQFIFPLAFTIPSNVIRGKVARPSRPRRICRSFRLVGLASLDPPYIPSAWPPNSLTHPGALLK